MKLHKSKKGFLYILTVSILIAIIILVFLSQNRYSYQDRQELYEARILGMNNFIQDFNEDIARATFVASFRSLLALEDHIATTGNFFNDTEIAFEETFYYGTINNTEVFIMNGSSFEDYLIKVNAISNRIGMNANITVLSVDLDQVSPWLLRVRVNTAVNVTDNIGVAAWYFQETYTTILPIDNLRDPLYSHFTDNRVPNTVRRLNVPFLVNTSNNDTSNLQTHIAGSYYLESDLAPSFLMRFENNNSASEFGIESLVDIQTISDQDIAVYADRIKVDYIYFNDLGGTKRCEIYDLDPSYYTVLTNDRLSLYEVDGLNWSTSCP